MLYHLNKCNRHIICPPSYETSHSNCLVCQEFVLLTIYRYLATSFFIPLVPPLSFPLLVAPSTHTHTHHLHLCLGACFCLRWGRAFNTTTSVIIIIIVEYLTWHASLTSFYQLNDWNTMLQWDEQVLQLANNLNKHQLLAHSCEYVDLRLNRHDWLAHCYLANTPCIPCAFISHYIDTFNYPRWI